MAVAAKVQELTSEQLAERDRIISEWQAAKVALETAKALEMEKRQLTMAYVFADANEGTNRVALANGWNIKGVRKITYTLEKDMAKVGEVDANIRALNDPEATELVAVILKRVYDFGESAYKKLSPHNPTHVRVKQMVDEILTTKDGAPTVELEEPKTK